MINALEKYLNETLGISQLLVGEECVPAAEDQTQDHTLPLAEMPLKDLSVYKVLVVTQILDPKHRILLEKILAASGIKLEWAYIADIAQVESILQVRTFNQTLVLGDFEEFRDQKEGEQRLRKSLGLTLKTFSLSQLEMSVEMKKLAWASLQIWMRQLKLDER